MNERQTKILDLLNEQQRVSVAELSELLNCSMVTIRNDIRSLAELNLLERVHGGAILKNAPDQTLTPQSREGAFSPVSGMPSGSLNRRTDEKRRIAAAAYKLIDENDTIILDDSSACYYLAREISERTEKRLAVLTNSLPSALLLANCPHVELYIIGGHVGGQLPATMGSQAIQAFGSVCVDKAFISVHSINPGVGLTSIGTPQMQIKKTIFKTASKVIVLADSSKFGAGYLEVVCPIQDAYHIVTDTDLDENYIQWLKENNISFELA